MTKLVVLLGDQLNLEMSSLANYNKESDRVLLAEVKEEASYVKHHKKKIAFVFSAMRHFSQELDKQGYKPIYIKYNDENNKGSLFEQVKESCSKQEFSSIVISHPGEYRLLEEVKSWQDKLDIPVNILEDNRFIASQDYFAKWAGDRKQYRMEFFYRELRKKTGVLMDDKEPKGGKWNYDADNRKAFGKSPNIPDPSQFKPDKTTEEVLALVEESFSSHFGVLDHFHYAVDREGALAVLNEFVETRLHDFGQYQDAMLEGNPWLFHSHIGLYLNVGLLMPEEVIKVAEEAYLNGDVPINSAEGFIRQILGWREYVRGFYWYFMPELKEKNYLNAKRKLPELYWTGETRMNCLSQCVQDTKEHAYAHHIQRLMVLGNFALLTGVSPKELNEWYLLVYADAYEWVEMPNVSSMVLFADGGKLASKPYAASGSYINKMSNYCQNCEYSVKEKTGPQACPFNYLYWHFLYRHQKTFSNNPRMGMIYSTMSKMDQTRFGHMLEDADTFLLNLENNEEV
ncbi:cryptochrome/photolyase family protein [Glaciecola sp. MF2-115]|uniref:cryptochrome/photolyase family protein n=1 Tax=Glaciecola sp. MF2-115 TaxID=3384827 RepID=UPI0039A398E6